MRQFVHYTNVKNYDIIIVYYEKKQTNNKGDYNMSKVKQWAEDTAEKSVDKILLQVKQNLITKETAKTDILNVENVSMTGIDENNVDEVISENA